MRPAFTAAALSCVILGLGSASLAQTRSAPGLDLDAALASIDPSGAGCVAGVALAGASPVIVARGQADLEHAAPLTPATIIETGSLAKQFTAAAVVLLVQDGKLSLDDDIRRVLPEMPDYGAPITIRHLLNHTSGLREQWSLMALTGNGPGAQVHTNAMILDLASRQKGLNFAPGAAFLYTNTNYALAAMIVERVSGTSLQAFTRQRLFQPLGMSDTQWRENFRTVVPGRASAYAPTDAGFVANMPFTSVYGNGGLLTTVGDLLTWNAFLDRPSALPGGPALAAALQTPGQLSSGGLLDYGLGLEITRDHGRRLVSHSGSTAGYKTWLGRYPDEGISIALMCNNGGIDPVALGERIAAQALLAAGHAPAQAAVSAPRAVAAAQAPRDLTPYQGLFRDPVSGDLVRLAAVGGQLTLTRGGSQVLTPLGQNRFQTADGGVIVFTHKGVDAAAFSLTRAGVAQTFVAVRPATGDVTALADYVGTYYSAELDTLITVARQGDALVMRQRFAVEWPLAPSFADAFTTRLRGVTTFVFARDAEGKVTGFGAWTGGARNVVFVRR
ncbi:serine hydrolase [Caulobacter sp. ErkDOM-E]|uniref:serine hydrolase n=1 Tax=Caulobacter sp. ErkDOM-E TaxID=3402778 RepID=UPI003AF57CCE